MADRKASRNLPKPLAAGLKWGDFIAMVVARTRKNISVPMGDGAHLRADLFRPRGKGPWPVIISAYPYQKDGLGASYVFESYYLVEAGYAVVLADLRGTGASDGVSQDPFDGLRGNDLYTLVEWCASRKWCDGKVGMAGSSYGGMAALRTAVERPPSLKAISSSMAPISFYDDVVFPGGSLNMLGVFGSWANLMNLMMMFPPLYIRNRKSWKADWKRRLEHCTPFVMNPAQHFADDAYWKNLEIDVERISVPTMIIEGWRGFSYCDGFKLYDRLQVPKRMIVGPWVHIRPSMSKVEPIDHIKEVVAWFDRWMKEDRDPIPNVPPLSIYVMGGNYWKYARELVPPRAERMVLHLHADRSLEKGAESISGTVDYAHDPAVGTKAGLMSLFTLGIDSPGDQAEDNLRSLCFDTAEFKETVEIVGEPVVTLTLLTDMPDAAITVRLCDVAPGGFSALITQGWLRLSRRNGLYERDLPEPGKEYQMDLQLWPADYQVKTGHRLRLALALSDFPHLFPLPYKGHMRMLFGERRKQELTLSVLPHPRRRSGPQFSLPVGPLEALRVSDARWDVAFDPDGRSLAVRAGTSIRLPLPNLSLPMRIEHRFEARLKDGYPDTATLEAVATARFGLGGRRFSAEARETVAFDRADVSMSIAEAGREVYSKVASSVLRWV